MLLKNPSIVTLRFKKNYRSLVTMTANIDGVGNKESLKTQNVFIDLY